MKKIATLAAVSVASFMAAGAANAATIEDVENTYSFEAFSEADEDWVRMTANRISECSAYGKKGKLRISLIVDSYNAIGEALQAENDSGAVAATERLARVVNLNERFESCWKKASRRAGVPNEFKSMLKKI